jgi:molybdopterin biosynthesis enzyme
VSVRAPRIRIVLSGKANDPIIASCVEIVTAAINAGGGIVEIAADFGSPAFEAVLKDRSTDAVIVIGGTGAGTNDNSVTELARIGQVAFHGIGLMPGDTAAIGTADRKIVLAMPGRIDASLAFWLVLGRRILSRLAGATAIDDTVQLKLSRKVTSTIGIADVILLKRRGGEAEPLTSSHWPMQALTQADTYLVVPPESEGFPAGAFVGASPLS